MQRRRAHFLCRRVWRRKFRVRLFELDQAAKEPVIVRVTDQRVVENVVLEIMFLDLLTKLQDLFCCGGAGFSRHGLGWDSVMQRESLRVKKASTIATANEVPTTLH